MGIILKEVKMLPEFVNENLQAIIDSYSDNTTVASEIMREFTVSQVEQVIVILLENLKEK